jgi:uncharacterized surface protein with fasciclin (FAS1) repeats
MAIADGALGDAPRSLPENLLPKSGNTNTQKKNDLALNPFTHCKRIHGCNRKIQNPETRKERKMTTCSSTSIKTGTAAGKNLVETAIGAGSFSTLVTAVKAAGLVGTLTSPGPFTVFAPTDEAFGKLPKGTVEALLKDIPKLKSILTYHVVAGKVMAADVVKLRSAKSVQGATLSVDASKGVKIGGANVLSTDIETSNGVIHMIDTVLIPA